ncbi:hypothetical protein Tco_1387923 [Tanacetum coccineum]
MGNEELSTIPEKKSDEFIKSSVEDLVPIPRGSRRHRFWILNDFTSSDNAFTILIGGDPDDVKKKNYSNLSFEFDDEYISSDVNPHFDEVLENI